MGGWQGYKPTSFDTNREMVLNGFIVRRDKIQDYFDDETNRAIMIYSLYKRFGFAYSGGWAEQPADHFAIIDLLDAEERKWKDKK
jgi:hypothetical protein